MHFHELIRKTLGLNQVGTNIVIQTPKGLRICNVTPGQFHWGWTGVAHPWP
uniref:Uncharacterized protein n=1 Tax=Anguilla anguilla TaxID=7936 RepID=A0A0E9RAS9_ANGAN